MELNIIEAQEGMWLTQSFLKDETSRVFSKKVFNPMNNWEEVKINIDIADNSEGTLEK